MYFEKEPLYPFGFGLSYSDFDYNSVSIDKKQVRNKNLDEVIVLNVNVSNNSQLEGEEVIQVYASYPDSKDLRRPKKHLRGFKKIKIPAGETVDVPVNIQVKDLTRWDEDQHKWDLEKGKVDFYIGPSSADLPLKVSTVIK